jgi:hypothetical protein
MIGRVIAAIAFLTGGAVTWVVLAILKGFGASQAAMSAGPVPASSAMEALIPWLVGSYFVVSAIGILFCQSRNALRVAALIAHLLLLITFLSMCAEGWRGDSEKFLAGFVTLLFVTVLWFSPGFIIWSVFLFGEGRPAQPGASPNGGPATPLGNSGVAEGPPSVS